LEFIVEIVVRGVIGVFVVVTITIFVIAVYISINYRKHIHIYQQFDYLDVLLFTLE
jgi:hypothetical protein